MARPFYPHEADDPDLDWLVSNFLYEKPDYLPVESGVLPLVLLPYRDTREVAVEPQRKKERSRPVSKNSDSALAHRPK